MIHGFNSMSTIEKTLGSILNMIIPSLQHIFGVQYINNHYPSKNFNFMSVTRFQNPRIGLYWLMNQHIILFGSILNLIPNLSEPDITLNIIFMKLRDNILKFTHLQKSLTRERQVE